MKPSLKTAFRRERRKCVVTARDLKGPLWIYEDEKSCGRYLIYIELDV